MIGKITSGVQTTVANAVQQQKDAITKYTNVGINNAKTTIKSTLPEKVISDSRTNKLVGDNSPLIFPENLTENFYIRFNAFSYNNDPKYKRANEVTRSFKFEKSVFLPLPSAINDTYGASYNPENLYFLGNALKNELSSFMDGGGTKSVGNIFRKETLSKAASDVADLIEKTSGTEAAAALATYGLSGLSGPLPAAAKSAFQVTTNPFPVMIYSGTGFKTYNFSWTLYPASAKESETIKKIVGYFRREMLPEQDEKMSSILRTPAIFEIEMKPNEYTKQFKRAVLTNLDVNYTPNGVAFLFDDLATGKPTRAPAAISITLTFQEIEIWLANDFYETEAESFDFKSARKNILVEKKQETLSDQPKDFSTTKSQEENKKSIISNSMNIKP